MTAKSAKEAKSPRHPQHLPELFQVQLAVEIGVAILGPEDEGA